MLVGRWQAAVDEAIEELTALEVPRLPELEDEQELLHDHKLGSNFRLMTAYDRCIGLYNELNQLHFELLLLAYGAYLTFFQFCQQAFPDMGMQVMTQMIAGYDTTMFRPDDELKALAAAALELGVDGSFADGRTPAEVLAELERERGGPRLDRRPRVAQAPVVLHVDRRRLLPPPPRLGRRPAAPVHRDHRLHRADPRRHEPRPPEGAAARRARPHRDGVRAAARDARGAAGVRRDARPLPPRLPARRGAQVLHRALGHLAVLQQDARDRRRDGRARLLRERRRHLLPQHPRGARGALRPRARLVGRHGRARARSTGRRGSSGARRSSRASPSGRRRRRSASCPR